MAKTKKTSTSKKSSSKKDTTVKVDRRASSDRRGSSDRRQKQEAVAAERRQAPRRKVQRRRQIDPTTCERDYTDREIEFMNAMEEYKRSSGRMFPTCSEILEVVEKLGYARLTPEEIAARQAQQAATTEAEVAVAQADED